MCPLRIILIFLSATLAGFFVIRNLKSLPQEPDDVIDSDNTNNSDSNDSAAGSLSKVRVAVKSGFWMLVDMASGKYLWRHLVSSTQPSKSL
ncbi:hypothetical protein Q3G72_035406 [Acer saccharum]|nr:hypothetical protein Q3G72_035406 [Acer saccharum]